MNNDITLASTFNKGFFESFFLYLEDMPNTVVTYKNALKQFMQWLLSQDDAMHPTSDTIRRYKQSLVDEEYKPNTIHLYITVVKRFFSFTEDRHLYPDIAKNIKAGKINNESPKKWFEADQVKDILSNIDRSTPQGRRNYVMLSLMFTCGLRTIEVSRARVMDIGVIGNRFVLMVQGKGQQTVEDFVPLPKQMHQMLVKYLKEERKLKAKDFSKCKEPLFISLSNRSKGHAISTRMIRKICKDSFIEAGYDDPGWTAHSTRHSTAVISLQNNGSDVRSTQMLLRHASPTTTEIYLHQMGKLDNESPDDVADAIFND